MGINLHGWTPGAAPSLGEGYAADSKRVTEFLTRTDEVLHALPPKRYRDERQLARLLVWAQDADVRHDGARPRSA